jgi:hypothetical protein
VGAKKPVVGVIWPIFMGSAARDSRPRGPKKPRVKAATPAPFMKDLLLMPFFPSFPISATSLFFHGHPESEKKVKVTPFPIPNVLLSLAERFRKLL